MGEKKIIATHAQWGKKLIYSVTKNLIKCWHGKLIILPGAQQENTNELEGGT